MNLKLRRGFTLIELLVVIAIIGILAGTLIYSYSGVRGRARDSKRIAELEQVRQALQIYVQDNQTFPERSSCVSLATLDTIFQPANGQAAYLPTIPKDPSVRPGFTWPDYCYISNGSQFVLWAKLETSGNPQAYNDGSDTTRPVHKPSAATAISAPPTTTPGYLPNAYFTEGSI